MSSRLRILIKYYPAGVSGYEVYRGGDALRYLEKTSGLKIERPINIDQLYTLHQQVKLLVDKSKGPLEIIIWRNRRGVKGTRYGYELDKSRKMWVFNKGTGEFKDKSAKLPNKKEGKKLSFEEVLEPRDR